MHLILKPLTRSPTTTWSDTHLCYEWDSCGTLTLSCVLLRLRGVFLFLQLRQVVLGHLALALSFGLQICRSKVSLLLFELLLDFDNVLVCRAEQGDVQELYLFLDVSM